MHELNNRQAEASKDMQNSLSNQEVGEIYELKSIQVDRFFTERHNALLKSPPKQVLQQC